MCCPKRATDFKSVGSSFFFQSEKKNLRNRYGILSNRNRSDCLSFVGVRFRLILRTKASFCLLVSVPHCLAEAASHPPKRRLCPLRSGRAALSYASAGRRRKEKNRNLKLKSADWEQIADE